MEDPNDEMWGRLMKTVPGIDVEFGFQKVNGHECTWVCRFPEADGPHQALPPQFDIVALRKQFPELHLPPG